MHVKLPASAYKKSCKKEIDRKITLTQSFEFGLKKVLCIIECPTCVCEKKKKWSSQRRYSFEWRRRVKIIYASHETLVVLGISLKYRKQRCCTICSVYRKMYVLPTSTIAQCKACGNVCQNSYISKFSCFPSFFFFFRCGVSTAVCCSACTLTFVFCLVEAGGNIKYFLEINSLCVTKLV